MQYFYLLGEICDTFVTDLMLDRINFKCVWLLVCWLSLRSQRISTKCYKTEAYVGFKQGSHNVVLMPVLSDLPSFVYEVRYRLSLVSTLTLPSTTVRSEASHAVST